MALREKILHAAHPFIRIPTFGLDISDRSFKYVEFEEGRGRRLAIRCFGTVEIPEGIIEGGEIKKEEEFTALFKSWRTKEGKCVRARYAIVSLPEERSFLRLIQMPKVKREEVANAVRWEIEAHIPLSLEELLYDFEIIDPLENHLDHFDVVVTAFPKKIVESYIRVLKAGEIIPAALELESQALARSVLVNLRERPAKIIIDLGRNRTGFIVFAGGSLFFTTTIELGGTTFEDNIMKALHVSREQATTLKKEMGLARKGHGGEVFEALIPPLAALRDELERTRGYYQDHAKHTHGADPAVRQIVLTGGDANLAGLDTYLASSMRIPVTRADPFAIIHSRMASPIPQIPKSQSLVYAIAIGLAMRGIDENNVNHQPSPTS